MTILKPFKKGKIPFHFLNTNYEFKVGSIYIMSHDYAKNVKDGELIIKAGTPVVITNIADDKITVETADKVEFDITSYYLFNTGGINGYPPKVYYKQVKVEQQMSLCYKICSIVAFVLLLVMMISVNNGNIRIEHFNFYAVGVLLIMLLEICSYVFSQKAKIPAHTRKFLSYKENQAELEILLDRVYGNSL